MRIPISLVVVSSIFFFVAAVPGSARAEENPYRSRDGLSFYSLIVDTRSDLVDSRIDRKCLRDLRAFFAAGGSLFDPKIRDAATPVGLYSYLSGKEDDLFYHYTDAKEVAALAAKGDYRGMFSFVRIGRSDSSYMNVFVAEDPISSASYGKRMVRFRLKPDALVIAYGKNEGLFKSLTRDKGLGKCRNFPAYIFLMLEENGIAVLDYNLKASWFQILRLDAIESFENWPARQW